LGLSAGLGDVVRVGGEEEDGMRGEVGAVEAAREDARGVSVGVAAVAPVEVGDGLALADGAASACCFCC
jgi:hypothetical protein